MHLKNFIDCPEMVTRTRIVMEVCDIEDIYLKGFTDLARGREEELKENVRKAISLGRISSDALALCDRKTIRSPDGRFRLLP